MEKKDTKVSSSFLSQKLPGGQAIINSIQQKILKVPNVRNLQASLRSKLHLGLISVTDFVETLEANDVFLDNAEVDVLERRLLNASGDMEYFKLMQTLDIGVPSEHVDPKHFDDPLPQPYRMITKLLELEIVDIAWLEVLRRHPEVAEDIPNGEKIVRRNRNLDNECFPSYQFETKKKVSALANGPGVVYMINEDGSFQIVDAITGKCRRTIQIFPEESDVTNQVDSGEKDEDDNMLHQCFAITNSSIAEYPEYVSRIAALKVQPYQPTSMKEESSGNTDKKNKKQDKKNTSPKEEVQRPAYRCMISIVETCGDADSNKTETRVLDNFECGVTDARVHGEVSLDGGELLLSHGTQSSLFRLVPAKRFDDPFGATSTVSQPVQDLDIPDEDEESVPERENKHSSLDVLLPPLCQWDIKQELIVQSEKRPQSSPCLHLPSHVSTLEQSRVWSTCMFPMGSSRLRKEQRQEPPASGGKGIKAASKSQAKDDSLAPLLSTLPNPSSPSQHAFRNFQLGLVVFLEDLKAFVVFGLRSMSSSELELYASRQNEAVDAAFAAAGGSTSDGAPRWEAKDGTLRLESSASGSLPQLGPLEHRDPLCLELLSFWWLSDHITAVRTDDRNTLLVAGQRDGMLSVWDLTSLQRVSAPACHQSAVTSIALTSGSRHHSVVSGDSEGTLCFFNIVAPTGSRSTRSPDSFPFVKVHLVEYRMDFTDEKVVCIWSLSQTSLAVVQLSSMKLVVYDVEHGELYGRISLTSGIPGQPIRFSLNRLHSAPQSPQSTTEEDGSVSQAKELVQAEEPRCSVSLLRYGHMGIACASSDGFCGSFRVDSEKDVLSLFSTEKLIRSFCPGVASLCDSSSDASFTRGTLPSVLEVFLALTKEERGMTKLKAEQASCFQRASGSPSNLKGGSYGDSNQGYGKATAFIGELTEEKLNALQKSFDPFNRPDKLLPISHVMKDRVTSPKALFEQRCKTNQADKKNRMKKLLSRLENLEAAL